MKLREHLKNIDINHSVNYFYNLFSNSYLQKEMKNNYSKENIRNMLTKMIEELINLPAKESNLSMIAVVKYMDFDDDKFYYDFDAFVKESGIDEHYGIEEIDWAEIIDIDVYDKSIEKYGLMNVINPILWSLSWHGFDYSTNNKNRENFFEDLREAEKEVKNGDCVTYTMEEVEQMMEEKYGIPKMTDEKREEIREKSQKCLAFNKKEIEEMEV